MCLYPYCCLPVCDILRFRRTVSLPLSIHSFDSLCTWLREMKLRNAFHESKSNCLTNCLRHFCKIIVFSNQETGEIYDIVVRDFECGNRGIASKLEKCFVRDDLIKSWINLVKVVGIIYIKLHVTNIDKQNASYLFCTICFTAQIPVSPMCCDNGAVVMTYASVNWCNSMKESNERKI